MYSFRDLQRLYVLQLNSFFINIAYSSKKGTVGEIVQKIIVIWPHILRTFVLCFLIWFVHYNRLLFLKSEGNGDGIGYSKESSSGSNLNSDPEPEPELEPEEPEDDYNFVQKTVNNDNLITVKSKDKFSQEHKLDLINLKATPASPIYNLLNDRNTILKEYKNKGGVYLIHNNVNGKSM